MALKVKTLSPKDQHRTVPIATLLEPPRRQLSFRLWLHMCYPHQSLDDLQNPVFWRDVVVETLVCMLFECLIIWVSVTLNAEAYTPTTLHFGLFAGITVYALIEGYGPVSGAPLNPAGCWGFFLAGRMSAARMVLYTIGEVGGAAAGAMIAFSLQPHNDVTFVHALKPGAGLLPVNAMAIEAILTFNMIFVALSVTNPFGKIAIMPSLSIAFCFSLGILSAGTHSGGLQNPMVSLGPAIITGDFQHHWVNDDVDMLPLMLIL